MISKLEVAGAVTIASILRPNERVEDMILECCCVGYTVVSATLRKVQGYNADKLEGSLEGRRRGTSTCIGSAFCACRRSKVEPSIAARHTSRRLIALEAC